MEIEELRARLLELGADIPLPTLRRWASDDEGLIPKPLRHYKPLERGVGRPKKNKGKEAEAHPGRFSYWTQESLEAAAAVWSIRYLARPIESSDDAMLSVKQTSQKDVPKRAIVQGQQMARSLHALLYSDCKEAANHFRKYLWPAGFSPPEKNQSKIATFAENALYSLILACIQASEKVRHRIALNTPVRITYEWAIKEDGSSAWKGIQIERVYDYQNSISLKVIHLKPCENGYSSGYGFPHVKEYMRDGFIDQFWLSGTQLREEFSISPFYRIPEGFYDDHEYVDFWENDPYGWADLAAGSHNED